MTVSVKDSIQALAHTASLTQFGCCHEAILDVDIRMLDILTSPLECVRRNVDLIIETPVLLQILSVYNLAAPSSRQTDGVDRLLSLKLTDGSSKVSAFELVKVPNLHLDIAPGTKLVLERMKTIRGKLLFEPAIVCVVGGTVRSLTVAHEQSRELARKTKLGLSRKMGGDGPPNFSHNFAKADSNARWASSASHQSVCHPLEGCMTPGKDSASYAPMAPEHCTEHSKQQRERRGLGRGGISRGRGRQSQLSSRQEAMGRNHSHRGRKMRGI